MTEEQKRSDPLATITITVTVDVNGHPIVEASTAPHPTFAFEKQLAITARTAVSDWLNENYIG